MQHPKRKFILLVGALAVGLVVVSTLWRRGEERPTTEQQAPTQEMGASEMTNGTSSATSIPVATPLIEAAGVGDLEKVKGLLEAGADINERAKGMLHMTPLIAAIHVGATNVVDYLLEHGADINMRDRKGWSPLIWAVGGGDKNLDLVKNLIAKGADVNARDEHGTTALGYAVSLRSAATIEIVKTLKEAGAKE